MHHKVEEWVLEAPWFHKAQGTECQKFIWGEIKAAAVEEERTSRAVAMKKQGRVNQMGAGGGAEHHVE